MPDWDDDSPALRRNLLKVLKDIRKAARRRAVPTIADACMWHSGMMAGLQVPILACVGRYRGEPGIEHERVFVGGHEGSKPGDVRRELRRFERRLQRAVATLDRRCPPAADLDSDRLGAVIDLCGWTHSEWLRIHPFVNGNGRTARCWTNSLLMRYGLPPVLGLRPRPGSDYLAAAVEGMSGNWLPTAAFVRRMLAEFSSSD